MSHQFMKEKKVFKCDIFDYISSKKGQIKKQRASSVQEGNNLFQIILQQFRNDKSHLNV